MAVDWSSGIQAREAAKNSWMQGLQNQAANISSNKWYNPNARLNMFGRMAANAAENGNGTLFGIGQKNLRQVQLNNEYNEIQNRLNGSNEFSDYSPNVNWLAGLQGDVSRYNAGRSGNTYGAPSIMTNSYNKSASNYYNGNASVKPSGNDLSSNPLAEALTLQAMRNVGVIGG